MSVQNIQPNKTTFEGSSCSQVFESLQRPLKDHTRLVSAAETPANLGFFEKIGGFVGNVLESIKSILGKIFCFCFAEGTQKKTCLESLVKAKADLEILKMDFIKGRDEVVTAKNPQEASDGFKKKWFETFEALPAEYQERILKKDIEAWSMTKSDINEEDKEQWINSMYADENQRIKCLKFVRDLETLECNGHVWAPTWDSQIPRYIERVCIDLQNEIEDLKS